MYLLDTNVVSELRKTKSNRADMKVRAWAETVNPSNLYISVITVLEIETGVILMERRDPYRGAVLRRWLDSHVMPAFSERILPIDTPIAQCCAKLHVPDPKSDRDALIAASALVHDMSVVTRNIRDFALTGVNLLNPWEYES